MGAFVTFWDNDAGSKIHLLANPGQDVAPIFIAGFPTERVPKMPLSGVSTRSGDLARFTFKGLDGTMTDLFIHLVAYQLVTLSGTGVSVLD